MTPPDRTEPDGVEDDAGGPSFYDTMVATLDRRRAESARRRSSVATIVS